MTLSPPPFRWKPDLDDDASADDLFARPEHVHLERMSDTHYWLGLEIDGRTHHIDIVKQGRKLRAYVRDAIGRTSLGPANDTDERVQQEIRAAEIAHTRLFRHAESVGWFGNAHHASLLLKQPDFWRRRDARRGYETGALARAIHDHDFVQFAAGVPNPGTSLLAVGDVHVTRDEHGIKSITAPSGRVWTRVDEGEEADRG